MDIGKNETDCLVSSSFVNIYKIILIHEVMHLVLSDPVRDTVVQMILIFIASHRNAECGLLFLKRKQHFKNSFEKKTAWRHRCVQQPPEPRLSGFTGSGPKTVSKSGLVFGALHWTTYLVLYCSFS